MLYRMEAFVGSLYPAIESSVLAEDASVLSGGLVRSSSGAVKSALHPWWLGVSRLHLRLTRVSLPWRTFTHIGTVVG